ncbi:MAG TPA: hypothetical protein VN515_08555 [Terriglobales bacterium]|nr:hypothetical protein [Terriglobales bacterium]
MHLPPITPHLAVPGASGSQGGPDSAKARQLRQAAQQFEGMLISTLWSGFQNDPMTAPDDSDPAADNIRTLGMQAMSTALSARGGLGFATLVERQLMPSAASNASAAPAWGIRGPHAGASIGGARGAAAWGPAPSLKPGGAEADKATKASSPKNVPQGGPE